MKFLSFATVFAAASGFVLLIVASWTLGESCTAEFAAYWGLFFALTGLIDGLMQETTRALGAARAQPSGAAPPSNTARPVRLGTWLALVTAAIVVVSGPVWIGLLLSSHQPLAVVLMALGLISYTYQAVLSGALSAMQLWKHYAWLVALDSGIRLALVIIAWLAGWGITVFIVVTVVGAGSWVLVLAASRSAREALRQPADVAPGRFARNVAATMMATGASAALITGFPTLVKGTSEPTAGAAVTLGGIIMAITLTRAPILVPLQRFQSALIVRFMRQPRALGRPLGAVFGVGVLGAAAAWLVGPAIMRLFFREDMFVPGNILAILTLASACTGALMITGTAMLAGQQHRVYLLGWVLATAVAFACLLAPLDLVGRVCLALTAGPLSGVALHLSAVFRSPRRRALDF